MLLYVRSIVHFSANIKPAQQKVCRLAFLPWPWAFPFTVDRSPFTPLNLVLQPQGFLPFLPPAA
jgi:hypothetical protein